MLAGSARASSRQDSESGDPVQAMIDEAVEAASEAAAKAAAEAAAVGGQGDAMEVDTDQVVISSDAALPARDSNDSLLRGSSPEAATAVPMEGLSPSHTRRTPPRTRLTPPPSTLGLGAPDLGWGLADKLR